MNETPPVVRAASTSASYEPAPHLRRYLRRYRFFDLDARRIYTVPVWTRSMMLFCYGEFFSVRCEDGRTLLPLGVSVLGPTTRPLSYGGGTGRYRVAAAELQPLALRALTQQDVTSFTDRLVDAAAVCGTGPARLVTEALSDAPDDSSRCRVLDQFFTAELADVDAWNEPAILDALRRIHADAHSIPLSELVKLSGMPERTFRRRFAGATGLSPRVYMRTLRAERALALLYHEPQTSIAEVVRILRFTDRPHLTRELKAATRATPAQLRQNRDTRLGPLVDFFTFTWASF